MLHINIEFSFSAFEMIRDNGKVNLSNALKSEEIILRAESFPQSSKTANEIVHLLINGANSVFKQSL